MVLIYRKSLKLSSASGGVGNIINLISNDCNRVAESFVNFHFLWSSALQILGECSISLFLYSIIIASLYLHLINSHYQLSCKHSRDCFGLCRTQDCCSPCIGYSDPLIPSPISVVLLYRTFQCHGNQL